MTFLLVVWLAAQPYQGKVLDKYSTATQCAIEGVRSQKRVPEKAGVFVWHCFKLPYATAPESRERAK